ncbi:MAG: lactoylglutathione lyase family protein [Bacteroidota bacterium]|nr:lactoylglutathione lyase family protein [Bacteroidota bacterium]
MQKFYQQVFDWDIKDMGPQMGNYRLITTGDKEPGINGGMNPRRGEVPVEGQAVNAFVCTVQVDDLDASMEKVKKAGGTIALDKMDVPGVGKLAYGKDLDGNIFGMLQPV